MVAAGPAELARLEWYRRRAVKGETDLQKVA